jgi:hypothetical protein
MPIRVGTWLRTRAPNPTPIAAHSAAAAALPNTRSVVAPVELHVDPSGLERRRAGRCRDGSGDQAEPRPNEDAHHDLGRDHATASRAEEEPRPDRPVADLGGDRHRAEEGSEQDAEEFPTAERHELHVAVAKGLRG